MGTHQQNYIIKAQGKNYYERQSRKKASLSRDADSRCCCRRIGSCRPFHDRGQKSFDRNELLCVRIHFSGQGAFDRIELLCMRNHFSLNLAEHASHLSESLCVGAEDVVTLQQPLPGLQLCGFLLLDWLGMWRSMQVIALVYLVAALVLPLGWNAKGIGAKAACVGLLLLTTFVLDPSKLPVISMSPSVIKTATMIILVPSPATMPADGVIGRPQWANSQLVVPRIGRKANWTMHTGMSALRASHTAVYAYNS